ncbi:urease accessory protein UreD [Marinomonas ushuaiensis DSM 15871]|uniref:Urease accessory protein UreD n=1 Tax=Marinomonas ushuaiensis DSM 15871 TaxID=1122207 RepID=X7E4J1_9GAMM|nr:urease accessory protein UreD [Marinomonas ushuaiensis]ETX10093.1 urease accessory protein UreD [Marinomonas ushuaiensis DSM 15871]
MKTQNLALQEEIKADESSYWHAFLTLGFSKTVRGTVLKTCDHKGPLYVQKPFYPEGAETAHVYLLHPPGGLVSGDQLIITANLAENTHVLITTPGAGRVYRARKDKTLQHQITQLNVAKNSLMEWLPQETILYPNAHTRLENCIELADDAKFIGWEITCFGLPANKESFGEGHAEQGFQIRQNGRLKVRERLVIDDNSHSIFHAKAGLDGQPINGLMIAGPFDLNSHQDELIDTLRQHCSDHSSLSGVSLVDEYIVVRSVHDDSEQMKQLFIQCWRDIRPALMNKNACVPRIWAT